MRSQVYIYSYAKASTVAAMDAAAAARVAVSGNCGLENNTYKEELYDHPVVPLFL